MKQTTDIRVCGKTRPHLRPDYILVSFAILVFLSSWYYSDRIIVRYQQSQDALWGAPRGNLSDLYPRWLGSRELLLHGRDPYSAEVTREIQVGFYGRALDANRPTDPRDQQAFAYPVYVAFLLAPTVKMPFAAVRSFFLLLLLVLTAVTPLLWLVFLGWRPTLAIRLSLAALLAGSLPAIQGVELQQLSLLVAFLVALSFAAIARGHLVTAGMCLAVATIKPQLTVPLIVWLTIWVLGNWRVRMRLAFSFAAMMSLLVIGAEIVLPGWLWRFRTAVAAYRQYAPEPGILISPALKPTAGAIAIMLMAIALAALCWRVRRHTANSPEFAWTSAAVVVLTLVSIPTIALYNQVLLFPALVLLFQARERIQVMGRLARSMYRVGCAVVVWPFLTTLVMAALALSISHEKLHRFILLPYYSFMETPLWVLVAIILAMAELWRRRLRVPRMFASNESPGSQA